MKVAVFWDVAWYSLVKFTDVSEVIASSIIRAMRMV
jgi:(2Fe-2S) ferredoxin